MSPLYLYAVLAEAPAGALPEGLAGEPMRLAQGDGVLAAVGEMAAAPELDGAMLRAHDAAVRALAARVPAILPARFGSVVQDEPQLWEGLRPQLPALREALAAVRGCDQMTLRFSRSDPAAGGLPAEEPARAGPATGAPAGPGTRYLAARRATSGDPRALPEVARVLEALAPFVRGERRERHDRPPLIASVYHLVPRDSLGRYRAALGAATEDPALRVSVSGPWPPYAFAPDAFA